jgi:hypothetical protein
VKTIVPLLALLAAAPCCDFDAAFKRYCQDNPLCGRDAAIGPEAGPEVGAEAGPESGPEASPERDVGQVDKPPPIPLPQICGRIEECNGANQICHPFAGVCVTTCETSDDCPRWLDTCAEIREPGGPTRSPKICTCSSSQVCANYTSLFVCNPADNLCEPLCAVDQDCGKYQPERVCDQATHLCQRLCFGGRDCPSAAQPRCDSTTQLCAGCASNSDCYDRPDGLTECSSTGACVYPN